MGIKFFSNPESRVWPVRTVWAIVYFIFALTFTGNVRAEYFVFAGGHLGYTYYNTLNTVDETTFDVKLDKGQRGNNGFDVLAAWGTSDYGVGFTYTSTNHLVKTEVEGIRLENNLQGPGIIFSSIRRNPQDSKTIIFIGVESLAMTTSASKCAGNEVLCDKLETALSDDRAQTVLLGIIDTSPSGLGIGITGRVYRSDVIDRAYDLNLLIGIGF